MEEKIQEVEMTKIVKGNVGFGFNQIWNDTPMAARWVFRTVLYTAAAINLILQIVVEIPVEIKVIAGKYSIYAVTLVHGLSKMFGIKVEEPNKT